jgi:hypothetical protein
MQTPDRTIRIETFGELVLELNYWHDISDESGDIQYAESKFLETLEAIRDYREYLINDLDIYFQECKATGTPIDLSYYRIYKQLNESTFKLF